MNANNAPLLEVESLRVWFPIKKGLKGLSLRGLLTSAPTAHVQAVDNVSLQIHAGEILGIVGESGCGKSTLARTILRLEHPSDGRICIEGKDMACMSPRELKGMRPRIQMIFQDPYASLNPRMTVFDTLAEPLGLSRKLSRRGLKGLRKLSPRGLSLSRKSLSHAVYELMDKVGLAHRYVRKYPHEFSGGQRQRIAIARALALQPRLLVADEPVSALDVSVQAQIINLLAALQQETGMAMIFISHDLSVVRHIAQRIAVMYLGRIVEIGPAAQVFENPKHPYTRALIRAIPIADPEKERLRIHTVPKGEPPSPINPPAGCRFHPRCPKAQPDCAVHDPQLQTCTSDHEVACPYAIETPL